MLSFASKTIKLVECSALLIRL